MITFNDLAIMMFSYGVGSIVVGWISEQRRQAYWERERAKLEFDAKVKAGLDPYGRDWMQDLSARVLRRVSRPQPAGADCAQARAPRREPFFGRSLEQRDGHPDFW
jgi:hypothetical protein